MVPFIGSAQAVGAEGHVGANPLTGFLAARGEFVVDIVEHRRAGVCCPEEMAVEPARPVAEFPVTVVWPAFALDPVEQAECPLFSRAVTVAQDEPAIAQSGPQIAAELHHADAVGVHPTEEALVGPAVWRRGAEIGRQGEKAA